MMLLDGSSWGIWVKGMSFFSRHRVLSSFREIMLSQGLFNREQWSTTLATDFLGMWISTWCIWIDGWLSTHPQKTLHWKFISDVHLNVDWLDTIDTCTHCRSVRTAVCHAILLLTFCACFLIRRPDFPKIIVFCGTKLYMTYGKGWQNGYSLIFVNPPNRRQDGWI